MEGKCWKRLPSSVNAFFRWKSGIVFDGNNCNAIFFNIVHFICQYSFLASHTTSGSLTGLHEVIVIELHFSVGENTN